MTLYLPRYYDHNIQNSCLTSLELGFKTSLAYLKMRNTEIDKYPYLKRFQSMIFWDVVDTELAKWKNGKSDASPPPQQPTQKGD